LRVRQVIIALLVLSLLGCAARPSPSRELAGAEEAVARAYAEKAPQLAPEVYGRAQQALERGRQLRAQGRYEQAESELALARWHAAKALVEARAALRRQEQEAAERRAQEEKMRKAAPAAKKPVADAKRAQEKPPIQEPPAPKLLSEYRVRKGDTLQSIAAQPEVYGDPLLWPLIYRANRDQIKDPKEVFEEQVFVIPRDLSPAAQEAARDEARSSAVFPVQNVTPAP